jgi:excisionase family DNA binding protein
MSSNIEVQRICQHCGNEFTARTTVTQYCSDTCSKRAYKARIKAAKIETSNKETQRIKSQPIEELKAKEFLTVTQVSKLIGCSRQNVYKLINAGKLRATNILQKKTIVKRSDLDKLFKEPTNRPKPEGIPETQIQELNEWKQAGAFNISDCYTLTEVQSKYGISETALQNLIKRNSIPKIKKGWFAYVPKTVIDKLLS